jgi:hypothetical protein
MTRFRSIIVCLLSTISFGATSAHSQYAATQDSTLRGIKKAYVNFLDVGDGLGQEAASELYNGLTLELRKAGIRIARDSADVDMSQDAILNVALVTTKNGFVYDVILRMDVEQRATLVRTAKTLQLVTWYYEDIIQRASDHRRAAPLLLTKATNEFLSKWLDANGR